MTDKRKELDTVPEIKLGGKSFFHMHYPVENSECAEAAISAEIETDGTEDMQKRYFL